MLQEFPSLAFPKDRKVLSVAEMADRLALSERHIIDLVEEGKIRALNVAGAPRSKRCRYRIPVESYEAYLRSALV